MWARVGYGTIDKITQRVLIIIHSSCLKKMYSICWLVDQGREEAKKWAEIQACYAWQGGWCIVDGILILFYSKPQYYGDLWFD